MNLYERIAVDLWAQAGAEMMIPFAEGTAAALSARDRASDGFEGPRTQQWRGYVHQAMGVVIALKRMGIAIPNDQMNAE